MNTSRTFPLDFATAWGDPLGVAHFRYEPEDFKVVEQLGFEPSGEGEHLCLLVKKRDQNTRWVAKVLAEKYAIAEQAIGYCGMKDRRAVTTQWFSIHQAQTQPDQVMPEGIEILRSRLHHKKLRRGMHEANDFIIRLREMTGDRRQLEQRLDQIRRTGVPNYFGEQRFGIEAGNLLEADKILARINNSANDRARGGKRRHQRGGIYLSAARAYLYNLVLSARVRDGSWNHSLPGEDIPSGPMWGRGRSPAAPVVRDFEDRILDDWRDWLLALEYSGLQQERRPLCLLPAGFKWQWLDEDLELAFSLPPGCFATSVLREVSGLISAPPAARGISAVL